MRLAAMRKLLLHPTAAEAQQGTAKDGHANQYGTHVTTTREDGSLTWGSIDTIPPPTPPHAAPTALLAVSLDSHFLELRHYYCLLILFSDRALRHWTIHRAWRLYQTKLRLSREAELKRQYQSMQAACEALRLIDQHGLTADERSRLGEPEAEGKEMGRLYRVAMRKDGIWDGVPIEYARIQTDSPSRNGWNHAWTR